MKKPVKFSRPILEFFNESETLVDIFHESFYPFEREMREHLNEITLECIEIHKSFEVKFCERIAVFLRKNQIEHLIFDKLESYYQDFVSGEKVLNNCHWLEPYPRNSNLALERFKEEYSIAELFGSGHYDTVELSDYTVVFYDLDIKSGLEPNYNPNQNIWLVEPKEYTW